MREPSAQFLRDDRITRVVHIAASPYKTGTTSLGHALIELGIGTRDMKYRPDLLRRFKQTLREVNQQVGKTAGAKAYLRDNASDVRQALRDFTARLAPFDVFSDAPFGHTHIHPFIRKALAPRAKFIWINRDFDAWVESVRNWEITHPETYPNHTIWETNPDQKISRLKRTWETKYADFLRLADDFPGDCLELRLDALEDYGAICAFYGIPDPGGKFPKRNITSGMNFR